PQAALLMPPVEIDRERPCRAAPARAHAITHAQIEVLTRIGRIARIDEHRRPPLRLEPVHVFRAGGGEVASTHRSIAVLHPETQIVVPAYRLSAAGAEQEGLRNSVAALGERDARLAAHDEDVAAAHWLVAHETRIQAQEVLLCQRDLRPTADLEFEQITVGGLEQVIDRALDPRPDRR